MGRLNIIERKLERFMREPPSLRNAAGVIVVATTVVVVGGGALISLIDNEEYPNVGIGMWWSLQTVTTVGYGDVAPKHLSGRLVGAVLMLWGTAFIAIVTAVITSTFVARASRDYYAAQVKDVRPRAHGATVRRAPAEAGSAPFARLG
jgi:voltage-gated potassium channel